MTFRELYDSLNREYLHGEFWDKEVMMETEDGESSVECHWDSDDALFLGGPGDVN